MLIIRKRLKQMSTYYVFLESEEKDLPSENVQGVPLNIYRQLL